jgi:hypothetical protein
MHTSLFFNMDGSCSVLKMGLGKHLLDLTCHSLLIYNTGFVSQCINMSDLGFSITLIPILGGSLLV